MDIGRRTSATQRYGPAPIDPSALINAATHNALRVDGEGFVGELLGLLHSASASIRSSAATALGMIGDDRVIPSLRAASEDPETEVATAAVIARARLGDESAPQEACKRFTTQLREGDAEERALAARALGALGLSEGYGPLVDALRDREPDVRRDAADAIAHLTIYES